MIEKAWDEQSRRLQESPSLQVAWAAAGLLVLTLYVGLKSGLYVDDAYITLKIAGNLAAGRGMVFNEGEFVLATTSPAWCLLNALAFWLGAGLGTTKWMFLLFLYLAGVNLVVLLQRSGLMLFGAVAAAFLILLRENQWLLGMEYSLALFLATSAVLLYGKRFLFAAGFCAGLLAWTRPEAVLFFPVLILVGGGEGPAWKRFFHPALLLGAALPLAAIAIVLYSQFGTIIPNTLAAKRLQLSTPGLPWFGVPRGAWRYLSGNLMQGPLVIAAAVLLGTIYIAKKHLLGRVQNDRGLLVILVWTVVHVVVLGTARVAYYDWYSYPMWLAGACSAGAGAWCAHVFIGKACSDEDVRNSMRIAVNGLLLFFLFIPWTGRVAEPQQARHAGYKQIAEEINRLSEGSRVIVLCHEIGVLGYYLDPQTRVIDEMSLIHKIDRDTRLRPREELLVEHRPEFLVESHPIFPGITPEQQQFQALRRSDDYSITVQTGSGESLSYRKELVVDSSFGMQILMRRQE